MHNKTNEQQMKQQRASANKYIRLTLNKANPWYVRTRARARATKADKHMLCNQPRSYKAYILSMYALRRSGHAMMRSDES
jgi:hypothetical protein